MGEKKGKTTQNIFIVNLFIICELGIVADDKRILLAGLRYDVCQFPLLHMS